MDQKEPWARSHRTQILSPVVLWQISFSFFIIYIYNFVYLLGCAGSLLLFGFSLVVESKGYSLAVVCRFLLVKALVFPVVMYGYENWTIRKAERQRIDLFEFWC